MSNERDPHSVWAEPHLLGERKELPAAASAAAGARDDLNRAQNSVFSEPALAGEHSHVLYEETLKRKRSETSVWTAVATVCLAGLLAGTFSIIGVIFSGSLGLPAMAYFAVAGPVIEEILKISGIVYLLERRPGSLTASWQLPLGAAVSALIFASIENVLYTKFYMRGLTPEALASLSTFRWTVCTALHVGCTLVATMGLQRVWRDTVLRGRPVNLTGANTYLAAAIVIHGLYNIAMYLLDDYIR